MKKKKKNVSNLPIMYISDKGSEFYNILMKSWLQNKDIKIYLKHNEGKSLTAEPFTRTLKSKIYTYMNSISENVYVDNLLQQVEKLVLLRNGVTGSN